MKTTLYILTIFLTTGLFAQTKKAEDFGFRHFQIVYKADTIDIVMKSQKGDEQKPKPIFFFCQGSQPKPLIIYDEQGAFGTFPFKTDSIIKKYHLVIVNKPNIPFIADLKLLDNNMCYNDPRTNKYLKRYSNRNYLDYYVNRNIAVIDYLQKQNFIDKSKLVVAGHSEGSTVAAKLAVKSKKVTHLIYASGNPLGRILSMVQQNRINETDTTQYGNETIEYWKQIVDNKNSLDDSNGDTPKATYDFSIPPIQYLEKLKIPVLVCYGTRDFSSPYNDYLQTEMIRQQKKNFTFKAYVGLDHNFFPIKENGQPDYDKFNWNDIANEWLKWTLNK